MVILFALITGLSIWEYCGLVNQKENVTVNRFISTVAGVYFFLAVAGFRMGIVGNFVVFVPYLLTILYLFISELYTGNKDAINDWAYTMLSQLYIALPFSMINVLSFETSAFDGQIHYDMLLPLSIFISSGPMIPVPIAAVRFSASISSFLASVQPRVGKAA